MKKLLIDTPWAGDWGRPLKDIDGCSFYLNLVDPNLTFNNIEITLAHLFRKKMQILGNHNYSDCLYQFLQKRNHIKRDIIEIGCGLGDLALNLLKPKENVKYDINSYVFRRLLKYLLREKFFLCWVKRQVAYQ